MTGGASLRVPRLRGYKGPAVLAYGFRPFFLLAGLSAVFGMTFWLLQLAGMLALPTMFTPIAWHAHEMLFGFAVAAIAGFLLTAIPNWTGRLPLQGGPLLLLVGVWFAGRLAIAASAMLGGCTAALVDLSFLAILLAAVGREIIAGRNWRNLPMLGALAALLVANGLMHAEALDASMPAGAGWRLGISVATLLITLIGGRIVPSFTRNWLAKRPGERGPAPFGRLDQLALGITSVALGAWIGFSGSLAAAALAMLAAALNAIRLARWRGHRTLAEPLVFILHAGYAWVALGLGLLAVAQATDLMSESAAVHGLTAGAIGTMTLAVMTRATRGHTGRPLHAGVATTVVYGLVTVSSIARVTSSLWPGAYDTLVWTAGLAWIGAFAGFVALYGPMLVRLRVDGKSG